MTQSKHTFGPWKHRKVDELDLHYIEDDFGNTICDLYFKKGKNCEPDFHRFDNAEANAHLIQYAHDMFHALEVATQNITDDKAWKRWVKGVEHLLGEIRGKPT